MATKRKFNSGKTYDARYTFPTRFDEDGNPTRTSTISTNFSGNSILKYGLKKVIWHHASRLKIPKGYSCVVDKD